MRRLQEVADTLPDAARIATQFAVDNAGALGITLAGIVVLDQLAVRAVRPRTPAVAVALTVLLIAAQPAIVQQLVKHRVLKFAVRDAHGCKHDLRGLLGEADADRLPAEA